MDLYADISIALVRPEVDAPIPDLVPPKGGADRKPLPLCIKGKKKDISSELEELKKQFSYEYEDESVQDLKENPNQLCHHSNHTCGRATCRARQQWRSHLEVG